MGLLSLAAAVLCFLVWLVMEPNTVHGSTLELGGPCQSFVVVHGYPCMEFQVKTEDGYVLGLQRIPGGRVAAARGSRNMIRGPVLLQHGVLMDGMTWLLDTPEQSLGFVLADSGFDVWISNTRGTRWSRTHTSLDPINPNYWAWSWDELVEHDLPAVFDFVYSQTAQKLHYVGHSMGTLTALAAFSQGKLMNQLKSAALLSPVAYLSHMTTSIGQLAAKALVGEITTITTWLGLAEFNPKGDGVINFLRVLCAYPGIDCFDLMTSFTVVRNGVISKFNYGSDAQNMRYYGESMPPIYNMSNIPNDLPLFVSYGGQDSLSDVGDVMLLLDNLKFHDGDKLTVQFIKDFAHADFVMGVSAKRIVYDALVAFFNRQL